MHMGTDLRAALRCAVFVCVLTALCSAAAHAADPIKVGQALDLVPADALSVVIVPDPKAASEDMAQCIARMERPESALLGRPLDLLKVQLGIGAGLDDAAPVVAWWQALAPGGDPALAVPVVVVGTTDPKQFLEANFAPARDVGDANEDAWRRDGAVIYARTIGSLVMMSPSASLVRNWQVKPGFAGTLQTRLGESAMRRIQSAELSAWAGPAALESMRTRALAEALREAGERATEIERFASVAKGMTDALVTVDVDPLGLSIRTLSIFDAESDLGKLAHGGPAIGAGVDRLPGNAQDSLLAIAIDLRGLGGGGPFLELAKLLGLDAMVPGWVSDHRDLVDRVQIGIYRSKLGYASGIFNDSAVFVETREPEKLKALVRTWIESMTGPDPFTGVERRPTWEESRTLKSGGTVTAFEVAADESPADAPGNTMMVRLAQQLIVGPKGFRGFVRVVPGGMVMTFSQRTDVLGRATEAAGGKGTMAESGTVRALRRWLLPESDIEGFIGVGPILRMAASAAAAFGAPMGAIEVPEKLEPVAFALSVQDGRVETAAMIPTGVLAIVWDQAVARMMPTPAGDAPTGEE